jgi:choline dehydrogenase-like flavoprotein
MAAENQFDVIIIGTGAGGGTLAYGWLRWASESCCSSGATMSRAKKANWNPRAVNVEGKYQTKEIWRDEDGKTTPSSHQLLRRRTHKVSRCGSLQAAEARLWREIQHHGGVSPAWPITYDDLEPYYFESREFVSRTWRARSRPHRAVR